MISFIIWKKSVEFAMEKNTNNQFHNIFLWLTWKEFEISAYILKKKSDSVVIVYFTKKMSKSSVVVFHCMQKKILHWVAVKNFFSI